MTQPPNGSAHPALAQGPQYNIGAAPNTTGDGIVLVGQCGPVQVQIPIPAGAIEAVKNMIDEARRRIHLVVVPQAGAVPKETPTS